MGKRIFDIFLSLLALLITAPLFLLISIVVKLFSTGPIFYHATRLGKRGKVITCPKFRTMSIHAKEDLSTLLKSNPILEEEWNTFHKLKNDPRQTSIGAFLRKTSLDELPQLWSVLKGDLSIVGPRPLDIQDPKSGLTEVESKYFSKTEKILSVRPGLVSLWQIQGRNKLTMAERAKLEEEYVDKQCLNLDLKIMAKTVLMLLFSTSRSDKKREKD